MAKFQRGQSGNPKGKPKGARSRYTQMRAELESDLPALLGATKEKALEGDMTAMRLLLERTLPPQKATAPMVELQGLKAAATLTNKADMVLDAVAQGELPPDIGASLIDALGRLAKLSELDEIVRRLEALEAQNGKKR